MSIDLAVRPSESLTHYGQAVWNGATAFLSTEEDPMDDNEARRKMLRH
jgi:hypothetical protein